MPTLETPRCLFRGTKSILIISSKPKFHLDKRRNRQLSPSKEWSLRELDRQICSQRPILQNWVLGRPREPTNPFFKSRWMTRRKARLGGNPWCDKRWRGRTVSVILGKDRMPGRLPLIDNLRVSPLSCLLLSTLSP